VVIRPVGRGAALVGLLLLLGLGPASSQALGPAGGAAGPGDRLEQSREPSSQPPLQRGEPHELSDAEARPALGGMEAQPDALPALVPALPDAISLAGGTTVTAERFASRALDQLRWYEVILPPGYESGAQRYPVLYMLHGAAGGATEWLEIGLHQAADTLWQAQTGGGFIIVLPDSDPFNYYLNHANGGPRYGDYLAFDLVQEIDSRYRTLPAAPFRAVGGLSMGGDGALRLGLTYPSIFGVVGAHSPTTRQSYDQRPGDIYGDESYWQQNNPLWLIRNTDTASSLQIWIDIGQDDVWLPSAQALRSALEARGLEPAYFELEGDHSGEYWSAQQSRYLQFYAQAFERALAAVEPPKSLPGVAEPAPSR
jgi:enterochelin esterase-like enzyme